MPGLEDGLLMDVARPSALPGCLACVGPAVVHQKRGIHLAEWTRAQVSQAAQSCPTSTLCVCDWECCLPPLGRMKVITLRPSLGCCRINEVMGGKP